MKKKVKWPDLEFVKASNGCVGCIFLDIGDDTCDHALSAVVAFTGVNCRDGWIFKRAKKWVQCTQENTKPGALIRPNNHHNERRILEHFTDFPNGIGDDCVVNDGINSWTSNLSAYSINLSPR